MNVEPITVAVRDLSQGYTDDAVGGVTAYGGDLDVRPPYQREFVYRDDRRDEVVRTILKGLPLNVMYWVDRGPDARPRYEVMDGQQRTISVCSYVAGQYSLDGRFFFNLPRDVKERILGYPLTVYVCSGTESEKLDWFRIVNIAGVQLNDQELLNAVYAGPWVTDARARFSKPGGPAVQVGGDWLKGSAIRQDYLATVLGWAAARHGASVEDYMGTHQHDPTAQALWSYFRSVLDWAQAVFPVYRREMKGLPWGPMYDANRDRTDLDPNALEARVQELMADEDVTRKSGVYPYLLDGDERHLIFERSTNAPSAPPTKPKGTGAPCVAASSAWRTCMRTTSSRGAVAGTPCRTTARCCAVTATCARARKDRTERKRGRPGARAFADPWNGSVRIGAQDGSSPG